MSKAYFYNNVKRLGLKALGINVTPQMFRHTSATYYAPLLDRATFCKRFGWSFASRMPDRYIDWTGIHEEKAVKAIKANDMQVLKEEYQEMKEDFSRMKEQMQQMKIDKDNYKLGFSGALGGKSKRSFKLLKQIVIDAGISSKDQKKVMDYFKGGQFSFDDSVLGLNPEDIPNQIRSLRKKYQSGWLEGAMRRRERTTKK
ncbi:MAG: hypothetical protein KKF65_02735 [Nanoarchaeota archaeon]|nr:hypothetical protein [Nanoarchaeota archaeon]